MRYVINLILKCLHFITLDSRWQQHDDLFINVFKGKINFYSIMDVIGVPVPTRQIKEFSTSSVSSAFRHSPSARCITATGNIRKFLRF
jgi:hypothetical protein